MEENLKNLLDFQASDPDGEVILNYWQNFAPLLQKKCKIVLEKIRALSYTSKKYLEKINYTLKYET